jgi:hypothetical protein
MFRLVISAAALLACCTACAAPAASDALASSPGASKLAAKPAETAAPNQLFPPLPSLASLPSSSADEVEDSAPSSPNGHHSKKSRRATAHKVAEAPVRVVVSDESRAYLAAVDRKLDEVLQGASHDPHVPASAVSVAMSR